MLNLSYNLKSENVTTENTEALFLYITNNTDEVQTIVNKNKIKAADLPDIDGKNAFNEDTMFFYIYFTYGNGKSNLTSADDSKNIAASLYARYDWDMISNVGPDGIYWKLAPNQTVDLLPGEQIIIKFSDVIVNPKEGASIGTIEYLHFEEKKKNFVCIYKWLQPEIVRFSPDKTSEIFVGSKITMKWETKNDFGNVYFNDENTNQAKEKIIESVGADDVFTLKVKNPADFEVTKVYNPNLKCIENFEVKWVDYATFKFKWECNEKNTDCCEIIGIADTLSLAGNMRVSHSEPKKGRFTLAAKFKGSEREERVSLDYYVAEWIGFSGGDGTKNNPFQISTEAEIIFLSGIINAGFTEFNAGVYYILTNDIISNMKLTDNIVINKNLVDWNERLTTIFDSTDISKWTPIGTSDNPFKANFDGNGFSIIGAFVEDLTGDNIGLFGYVDGGIISGLDINLCGAVGNCNIGSIVGCLNKGSIVNCIGRFIGVKGMGANVGGIVGCLYEGSVINCAIAAAVEGEEGNVGGIVGSLHEGSSVVNCFTQNVVQGKNSNVGGIVGYIYAGSVINCNTDVNLAQINGGGDNVGGIAGNMDSGTVFNCYNTAEVSAEGWTVGGIAGFVHGDKGSVQNCYNIGEISGKKTQIGEIAGVVSNGGTLFNCYFDESKKPAIGSGIGTTATFNKKGVITSVNGLPEEFVHMQLSDALNIWVKDTGNPGGIYFYWKNNASSLPEFEKISWDKKL